MISILTPTYNRAKFLLEIALCLDRQTNRNFEWVIVDDGSTDETEEIVTWIKSTYVFPITFIKQNNGGKHTAINLGVQKSSRDFILILDSDDLLIDKSIENIYQDLTRCDISQRKDIAGLIYQIGISENVPIHKKYLNEKEIIISDYITANFKLNMRGDRAEIYKREILLKNKFPVFENEKFLSEGIVWGRIASKGYKLVYIPKVIYLCRYQQTGLSANSLINYCRNWRGTLLFYSEIFSYPISLRSKTRYYISFLRRKYGAKNKDDDFFNSPKYFPWKIICIIIAKLLHQLDLRRTNE